MTWRTSLVKAALLAAAHAAIHRSYYQPLHLLKAAPWPRVEPCIAGVRGAQHAFYGATADFSETALAAFADAFLAGELSPHVKPDPRDEL